MNHCDEHRSGKQCADEGRRHKVNIPDFEIESNTNRGGRVEPADSADAECTDRNRPVNHRRSRVTRLLGALATGIGVQFTYSNNPDGVRI